MFEDRIGADASGDQPPVHPAVPRDTAGGERVVGVLVCGPDGPDSPLDEDDDRYQSLDPVGAGDPREQWSDEQWTAAIDQWAAADPDQRPRPSVTATAVPDADANADANADQRPEPSVAEVLTAAGRDRVGPQTVSGLTAIDPMLLDAAELVSAAQGWSRVANHANGQLAAVVARLAATGDSASVSTANGVQVIDAHRLAAAELAPALGLGIGAADTLVSDAHDLVTRLPATLAAVLAGDLAWVKASYLAQATSWLTPEQAAEVEARVLPRAAGRTPARHREAVRKAVERVDPAGVAERRRQAQRDVAFIRSHYGDGMAEVFLRLPSEDADIIWTGATAWARRAKAAGDPRTLDELRIAAIVQWASSFLTHGDSTTCDQHCTHASAGESSDTGQPDSADSDVGSQRDDRSGADGQDDNGPSDVPGDAGPDGAGDDDTGPEQSGDDDRGPGGPKSPEPADGSGGVGGGALPEPVVDEAAAVK